MFAPNFSRVIGKALRAYYKIAGRKPSDRQLVSNLAWLYRKLRPHLKWQLLSAAFVFTSSVVGLVEPLAIKRLVDVVLPTHSLHAFGFVLLMLLVAHSGKTVFEVAGSYCDFRVYQRMLQALRLEVFAHLTQLSASYHENTPPGESTFLFQECIDRLGWLSADLIPVVLRIVSTGIVTLVAMYSLSTVLWLEVIPMVIVLMVITHQLQLRLRAAAAKVQEEATSVSGYVQERIAGITQLQLLNRERRQRRELFKSIAALSRLQYHQKRANMSYWLASATVIAIGIVVIVLVGGIQVMRGVLSLGALLAFYALLVRLVDSLHFFVEINGKSQELGALVDQIRHFLKIQPSVPPAVDASVKARRRRVSLGKSILVDNISFSYRSSRTTLRDLELSIESGQRIALVGPSGSGKSTAAKVIARLYDVDSGTVLVGGRDVRTILLSDLRKHMVYLPQRAVLFAGTIEDNLTLGKIDASRAQLREAVEVAQIDELVRQAPNGWKEQIGPGGSRLSGGERQRLAIARTILQQPQIVILDESTGELDLGTERSLLDRLNCVLRSSTMVLISHRLSSLTWVDRINVLDDGRIVASGSHQGLLRESAMYGALYMTRLADDWISQ